MFKGAFGAGFAKGFGTTFAQGIEDRRERREKYIELGINNAKKTASKYAKANAEVEQTAAMLEKMKNDFKLSNEEVALIAQNHDVNEIYKTAYTNREVLKRQGLDGDIYTRDALLAGLKMPEGFSLPEATSVTDITKMVLLGTTQNAIKNRDDSEAGRSRNLGAAVSKILLLDPKASAQTALQGLEIGGYDISELEAYEASGGVPQTPFDAVQGEALTPITIEYDDDQAYQTNRRMLSTFTKKFTGFEDFDNYADTLNKKLDQDIAEARGSENSALIKEKQTRDLISEAANVSSKFELQLIQQGLTDGMNIKNARTRIMTDIATQMTGVDDLQLFVDAVNSGNTDVARRAVEMHKLTVQEGMRGLTEDEVDYILMGGEPTEESATAEPLVETPTTTDDLEATTVPADSDMELPTTPFGASTDVTEEPVVADVTKDEDGKPIFEEPTLANLGDLMAYYAEQEGVDLNDRSDENRDARTGIYIKAQKEIAGLISYDEWKEIRKGPAGKQRLQEMGLPTTYAEAAAMGLDNFGQPQEVKEARAALDENIAQRPEATSQEALDMVQEEKDVFNIVAQDALDAGKKFRSPEAAKQYVKTWFRDNIPDGVYDDETLNSLQDSFAEVLYNTYQADPAETPAVAEDLQAKPEELDILQSVKNKG